jgi:hypothetical protein
MHQFRTIVSIPIMQTLCVPARLRVHANARCLACQDEVSDGRPGPMRDDLDEEPPHWNEMDDEDPDEPSDGSGKGVQQVKRVIVENVDSLCLRGSWECLCARGCTRIQSSSLTFSGVASSPCRRHSERWITSVWESVPRGVFRRARRRPGPAWA